jgi:hypothetical protein
MLTAACGKEDGPPRYVATLVRAEQPVPVITQATGDMTVVDNGTTMTWTLNAYDIEDVTAAHIHEGAVGIAGDVLVDLSPGIPSGFTSGLLSTGTFAQTLNAAVSLDSIRVLMTNGGAYVDVHTLAEAGAHIRGQLTRDD